MHILVKLLINLFMSMTNVSLKTKYHELLLDNVIVSKKSFIKKSLVIEKGGVHWVHEPGSAPVILLISTSLFWDKLSFQISFHSD